MEAALPHSPSPHLPDFIFAVPSHVDWGESSFRHAPIHSLFSPPPEPWASKTVFPIRLNAHAPPLVVQAKPPCRLRRRLVTSTSLLGLLARRDTLPCLGLLFCVQRAREVGASTWFLSICPAD